MREYIRRVLVTRSFCAGPLSRFSIAFFLPVFGLEHSILAFGEEELEVLVWLLLDPLDGLWSHWSESYLWSIDWNDTRHPIKDPDFDSPTSRISPAPQIKQQNQALQKPKTRERANRKKKTMSNKTPLFLPILNTLLSLILLSLASKTLSAYTTQHSTNPWWLPVWTSHFVTKGLLSSIICSIILFCIALGNVILVLRPLKVCLHSPLCSSPLPLCLGIDG